MKSMVILGSTGSIGTQALDVARLRNFTVKALTSNSNIDLLEKQIREFKPEIAAVADESRAAELRIKSRRYRYKSARRRRRHMCRSSA